MTPEQQARVITQLIEMREAAKVEYVRYLQQFQALDLAIRLNLPTYTHKSTDKVQGLNPSLIIVDDIRDMDITPGKISAIKSFYFEVVRPLTNKKRTGKLDK